MLALNLQKIRTAHEHVEREYTADAVGAETDAYRVVAPVSLAFDIYKDADKFRLVGRVKTTLEMPCSRCLEQFQVHVDAPFELRYQRLVTSADQGEREIQEDDFETAFYENDEIDLGQR